MKLHIINNGKIVELTGYEALEAKDQEAKTLKSAYEAILDDVMTALNNEEEESSHYAMLDYLTDLMVFDLAEFDYRLPSLMQSTVEEMEKEYKENIVLYPEFESFIDRIRALYS